MDSFAQAALSNAVIVSILAPVVLVVRREIGTRPARRRTIRRGLRVPDGAGPADRPADRETPMGLCAGLAAARDPRRGSITDAESPGPGKKWPNSSRNRGLKD